ncbi:hypothetical protein CASFOL_009977 [Castilleja foliolosa]|uniref:Mitochondrial transcription termination factor family protein n=1 Tax=Castilleja foliolosa TaxID=1961234 RepID=A0ABD3DT44_9LAMI
MFAIFCRGGLKFTPNRCIFVGQQFWATKYTVFARLCSSSVCENASEKTFTVSYLINSCGLSSNEAVSVSKKLCIKSPQKPDAVLELLREYGFTKAYISKLVIKLPNVILCKCPNQTLLPKLEFFLSIGVPRSVLARKLSVFPFVLRHSLKDSIIPSYNYLKTLLGSDERVVTVFLRAPMAFDCCWAEWNLFPVLKERGVPESNILYLFMCQPTMLMLSKGRLTVYVDRAVEMGFDISKTVFVVAIRVLSNLSESNLKRKMDVFRKYGWSESDISTAFLRCPFCMSLSEKKLMANMEFLVNEFGCKPVHVARNPVILSYNLDKRIKPRCLVAKVLDEKGLKNMNSVSTLLKVTDEVFVKSHIVKYEKDVPELLDIYLGKVEPPVKWVSSRSNI